jgi:hypothetical protein
LSIVETSRGEAFAIGRPGHRIHTIRMPAIGVEKSFRMRCFVDELRTSSGGEGQHIGEQASGEGHSPWLLIDRHWMKTSQQRGCAAPTGQPCEPLSRQGLSQPRDGEQGQTLTTGELPVEEIAPPATRLAASTFQQSLGPLRSSCSSARQCGCRCPERLPVFTSGGPRVAAACESRPSPQSQAT